MQLSKSSESRLKGLKPKMIVLIKKAAELAKSDPNLDFDIVQGNRTQAYQNQLYAQGRTRPGKKVTWTKNSKHIGGGAIDFAALVNGKISWDAKLYPMIAAVFQQASKDTGVGITWGGDWNTKDWGHIELNPGRDKKAPGVLLDATPDSAIPVKVEVPAFATIKKGSKGDKVAEIQSILKAGKLYSAKMDADFGKLTEDAVKAFQKSVGLEEDGKVGPMTWTALQRLQQTMEIITTPKVLEYKPMSALTAGEDFKKIVRFYEGESLKAYKIGGKYHIGIGHNGESGYPPRVYEGMSITKEEQESIFLTDSQRCEMGLKNFIKVPLTQMQFDALLSLYFPRQRTFDKKYQAGSGKQPGDDLLDAINAQDWARAELEFLELENAPALDGKVYAGLIARRSTEADCFAGRQYSLAN